MTKTLPSRDSRDGGEEINHRKNEEKPENEIITNVF